MSRARPFSLVVALILGGCFETNALEGAPCTEDATCGPGRSCHFGSCRDEAFEPCGDDVAQIGEFCFRAQDGISFQAEANEPFVHTVYEDFDDNGLIDGVALTYKATLPGGRVTLDGRLLLQTEPRAFTEVPVGAGDIFMQMGDAGTAYSIDAVAIGNVVGDARKDYLLATSGPLDQIPSLLVFENRGVDASLTGVPAAVEFHTVFDSLLLGRFAGDDDLLDLVVIDYTDGDAPRGLLAKGASTDVFGMPQDFPVGERAGPPAKVDLDGDGFEDLLLLQGSPPSLDVYFGGPGGLEAAQSLELANTSPIRPAIGDIDADGDLDIVVASSAVDTASVFINEGGELTVESVKLNNTRDLVLADLDGDGQVEAVAVNATRTLMLRLYPTAPDALPEVGIGYELVGAGGDRVEVLDVDGDEILDLAIQTGPGIILVPGFR